MHMQSMFHADNLYQNIDSLNVFVNWIGKSFLFYIMQPDKDKLYLSLI